MTHITYHCYRVHNDGYTAHNHVPDHFRHDLNCQLECLLLVLLNYSTKIRDPTDMPIEFLKHFWLDFLTSRIELYRKVLFRKQKER